MSDSMLQLMLEIRIMQVCSPSASSFTPLHSADHPIDNWAWFNQCVRNYQKAGMATDILGMFKDTRATAQSSRGQSSESGAAQPQVVKPEWVRDAPWKGYR